MSGTQQPEALRLADKYEVEGFLQDHRFAKDHWCRQAAAELRHQHARIAELEDVADMAIKRIAELEAQLSAIGVGGVEAPAAPVSTYVEVRECSDCGHVGINDTDGSKAACNTCEWYGDSPREDKCPGCNRVGTMTAACPKCGSRTLLLAETHLLVAAPARSAEGVPVQAVQPSDALIEAVDAWFADNTGLGGCSDKDVAELAAIFATQPAAQGLDAQLVAFIEKVRDFTAQAVRVGSKGGEIRWDIEFGHYGAEVRGKTLRDAITKAMAVQTKKEGEKK